MYVVWYRMADIEITALGSDKRQPANEAQGLAELAQLRNRGDYPLLLEKLKDVQQLPSFEVEFENLTVTRQIPVIDPGITTVASKLVSVLTRAEARRPKREFRLLGGASGVCRSGSMTLILAPPGHGKSTLLKTLAGVEKPSSGSVRYNGQTRVEARADGFNVDRAVIYVDQVDCHLPLFTVRETFQFAVDQTCALPNSPELQKVHQYKVDAMLRLLGLEECADTVVGNELIRGVSGGQKKRVTIGEALLTDPRGVFLDEITNGLDASTAVDIVGALRQWAALTDGVVVAALLQPTPEIFELFDNLILLREGTVVYSGPRQEAIPYLEERGIFCPGDVDLADFLIDFLSSPPLVYERQLELGLTEPVPQADTSSTALPSLAHASLAQDIEAKAEVPAAEEEPTKAHDSPYVVFHFGNETASDATAKKSGYAHGATYNSPTLGQIRTPLSTAELEASYKESRYFAAVQNVLYGSGKKDGTRLKGYAKAQYTGEHAHSFWQHTKINLERQGRMMTRNKGLIAPRLSQSIIFGLILGSLFYQKPGDPPSLRIGLMLFCCMFLSFSNMVELPIVVEAKRVVKKQLSYSFYPTLSYIFSVILVHMPLALTETAILGSFIYWMTGFVVAVDRYFVFLGLLYCINMAMSVLFRMIGLAAPNIAVAQTQVGPLTAIFMIFGGFLITRGNIPPWFIWAYWLSPFSWVLRAMSINEFKSDRYDETLPMGPSSPVRVGDLYLDAFDIPSDFEYQWGGAVVLLGYFVILTLVGAFVLKNRPFELSRGTKRTDDESDVSRDKAAVIRVRPAAGASRDLPFAPATLVFNDIHFTVMVKGQGKKLVPRPLLRGINGYAKPGTLTALMGATGAGKTTLIDVLAGRKTQGEIKGEILVNGKPKEASSFARLSGYVEQNDNHFSTSTVYETMLFAADLRLPSTVTGAQKTAFVEEVMDILELTDLRDRLIGDADDIGLSPGQLKRVTIGVELVANPSILFLDEPTTGLDARAAMTVMRVIRRIASTGRSVICTIHQPSAEVFYMFDRLLLLQSGGYECYFGPLGHRGAELVRYLESCPDVSPKPRRMNPASWMLDVIGAGAAGSNASQALSPAAASTTDGLLSPALPRFPSLYAKSDLRKVNQEEALAAVKADSGAGALLPDGYAATYSQQFTTVLKRMLQSYWRNTSYNFTRLSLLLFLGLLFGFIYFDLDSHDEAGVVARVAILLTVMGFCGILNSATATPVLMKLRPAYYRERMSGMYSSSAYAVSIFICEIPYIFAGVVLITTPLYFLVGLRADATDFFKFLVPNFLNALCYNSTAQLLSALMPNIMVAGIMQGMYFSMFMLFGGIWIPGPQIPAGWKWFYAINPIRYALEAASTTQFECRESLLSNCPNITTITGQTVPLHTYVETNWGYNLNSGYADCVGYLVLWLVVMRILVSLTFRYVSHIKR